MITCKNDARILASVHSVLDFERLKTTPLSIIQISNSGAVTGTETKTNAGFYVYSKKRNFPISVMAKRYHDVSLNFVKGQMAKMAPCMGFLGQCAMFSIGSRSCRIGRM